MKIFLTFILHIIVVNVFAQQQEKVFSVAEFIEQVKQFHPIAKQANLKIANAKANLMSAKGSFDPVVNFEASRKTFDGKNYYFYTNPEIKIPLPIGDIKTGIENNGGSNLSSEESLGKSSYFGVEIPLAKGLILDKRRAVLQQAKVLEAQSQQEKLEAINNLLFKAYTTYYQWAGAQQLVDLYTKYIQINSDRLKLIKITTLNGDRSIMDTVEAITQLQNFQIQQADALLKLNNAAIELSSFLWQQTDSAYLLPEYFVADANQLYNNNEKVTALNDIILNALQMNPSIKSYNYKIEILEIEKKLKKQSLLPTLNAKANLLNKDYAVFNGFDAATLQNNYKWGIDFKLPIFLREARGDYEKSKIKISETSLDLKQKIWEVENKIRTYYNESVLLKKQIEIGQSAFENYNRLYKNELLKFNNGESSLFLVNSRENKTLEMLQKNIDLTVKYFKAKYAIDWAAGTLN